MLDRIMARAEAIKAEATQPVATQPVAKPTQAARPRVRTSWGKDGVIKWPLPKITSAIVTLLKAGDACPHCKGTGVYKSHQTGQSMGACHWCHDPRRPGQPGKGYLTARDLTFVKRRMQEDRLYMVTGA
jgi:hypothetical protein